MSKLTVYTAAEASERARIARATVDAACATGALVAVNAKPDSSKKSWRILDDDLRDWVRRGFPTKKSVAA